MSTTKRIISSLLLVALIAIPLSGCPTSLIDKWEAIKILVTEIIPPAADDSRISAFMPSEMLIKGDMVTSEDGTDYPIDKNTWFIFIDDAPQAFYAHPTRYVFMDARTGTYDIVDESWPPLINNYSMWDTDNVGRGHLIEVWSVLGFPAPIAGSASTAPTADYGDAPDGLDDYYGDAGQYPTLYDTANSHFGRPGGHTLNIGEETLGFNVSPEVDANDPTDPDGVPNLVDADSDERIYVIMELAQAKLAFTVAVSANAPDMTRHANALIDFDQSGNWSDGAYGTEWVAVNLEVLVKPGTSDTVITPLFPWGNKDVLPWKVWMRLALTRAKIDESQFANVGGWDGSGQFEYGEIEDYCAFLTDNPPPDGKKNGEPPNGNGEPPKPGPKKGPCGYDIKYYVITISGGDTAKDMKNGTPIVQRSIDTMANAAAGQGYISMGNLGPGNNSVANIGQAIDNLVKSVKCGDYVLIYICGHGYSDKKLKGGGIALKNSSGKTEGIMKPGDLANLLGKIKPCKDQDCETPNVCCHVTVIIESCYAGNFNTPDVAGEGRVVVGTSTDTPSRATADGGVYTSGFVGAAKDPKADTDTPPDGVDPLEADAAGKSAVDKHRNANKTGQQPWSSASKWCECKCPCKPEIDVEKWVWDRTYLGDDPSAGWVDSINAHPDQAVNFLIEVTSSGKCRSIAELELVDFLPDCLEYYGEAIIFIGDEGYDREPNNISQVEGGMELSWDLKDLGILEPGKSIAIEYIAFAEDWGENVNWAYGSACCSEDPSVTVNDQDSATVMVVPPVEDAITGHVDVDISSSWTGPDSCESFFDIYFVVEDLTGGDFPLTNVTLNVNGEPAYDSGPITESFFDLQMEPMVGNCGDVIDVELVAMSLVSPDPIVIRSETYVLSPPSIEYVMFASLYALTECSFVDDVCQGCTVTYTLTAEDLTGVLPIVGIDLFTSTWGEEPLYTWAGSEPSFEITLPPQEAGCSDTIDVEMVAMNLIGHEAHVIGTVDTSEVETIIE